MTSEMCYSVNRVRIFNVPCTALSGFTAFLLHNRLKALFSVYDSIRLCMQKEQLATRQKHLLKRLNNESSSGKLDDQLKASAK